MVYRLEHNPKHAYLEHAYSVFSGIYSQVGWAAVGFVVEGYALV